MDTDNIAHWRELVAVYKKRSHALEIQVAKFGNDCPPHLQIELAEVQEQIGHLEQKIDGAGEPHHRPDVPASPASGPVRLGAAGQAGPPLGRIECPYPGMVPFRAADARFFYGRDAEIQQMLQHLRYHRYLFVIGPSGSGKSSLVSAGLLPKLQTSTYFAQDFWLVREMRPGSRPLLALAQALGGDPSKPAQALTGLLAAGAPAQRVLLVIDQFEEVFAQAERAEQNAFIDALHALRVEKQCTLLIAMRADFYPDLMISDLWPVPPIQRLEIAPLRGEALRQAIQQPATDVGVTLEVGLLERLLADAADEPGVLPLVQETMVLLWDRMERGVLSLRAYEALGGEGHSGLAVAVATRADAILDEFKPDQRAIARRIFLRLVQFGEGRADTRRQQPVDALRAAGDNMARFEYTLRHLVDNRLLTLGGEEKRDSRKVDLAHEALIAGWPTLQEWLNERREAEQTRRRLESHAAEWVRMGQGLGGLLDEIELREAERWLDSPDATDLGFDIDLTMLVDASRKAAIDAAHEKEALRLAVELEQQVRERTAELAEANVQLSAERERLSVVHAITLNLAENLDLDETLMKAVGLSSKAVGARRGSIMLRDPRTRTLICRAVLTGDGSVESINAPIKFTQGSGLVGWVMIHQQGTRIGDVRKDARWLHEQGRAEEIRSVVAVPLITKDEPLGVLILSSPEIDYFSPAQEQLLTTIANEVAIVIHNAELYGFINDLAAQLAEAYEQQREETTKSQAILQSVTEGVIVLDEQQRVILFNPAAEQVLGIPASFILQKPFVQLQAYREYSNSIERAAQIYAGLNHALGMLNAHSEGYSGMLDIPSPAQSILLNLAMVFRPDGVRYGSVAVLRDVTREIEADRAKRDFISSVSHELRTPLTAIKGYLDLLLLGVAGHPNEAQAMYLGVAKNNTNRLMDLITDILNIGGIDANKIHLNFEQVNITDVFQDVLQTLRVEIERKSLAVSIDIREDVPLVTADFRRLTQVMLNLTSNAVKYTYSQGRIVLRAFLNRAGLLQVEVEDNGVGISPEQQRHLFRRFYRADNPLRDEVGGTGLGLSIAKSFVELHDGEMWVQSEVGAGSTFSFILPVTRPELPQEDE